VDLERLEHAVQTSDGDERIDALIELAWELADRGDRRSLPLSEEALAGAGASRRAVALITTARCRWLANDYAAATEYGESGLKLLEENDGRWRARALTVLGLACSRRDDLPQALEYYRRALAVARSSGNKTAGILSNMATILAEQGDLPDALRHLQEAIRVAREGGHLIEGANARSNLGIVFRELGLYDQALKVLMEAVASYDGMGCRLRSGSMLGVMASVYQRLGEQDKASRFARDSLDRVREFGHPFEIAFALHRVGNVLAAGGNDEAALEALEEGLALAGVSTQAAVILRDIAQLNRHAGNRERALESVQRALDLARSGGNRLLEAQTLLELAKVRKQADPAQAIDLMREALELSESAAATPMLTNIHRALSVAYEAAGDHHRALKHHRIFHEEHEKMFNRQSDERVRSLQVIHEVELERARAEDAEQQVDDLLRSLPQRLLLAQEEERRAIARELHDHVSQRLTAATLDLANLAGEDAAAVRATVQRLARDVHGLSRRIHPAIVNELGLGQALEVECNSMGERAGWKVEVTCDPLPALPEDAAIALYRIAQEAIRNAAKHAAAARLRLSLVVGGDALVLRVEDNGAGFDRDAVRGGLGLTSMAERARLCGGQLEVHSTPGQGTAVEARVPLPTAPEADAEEKPDAKQKKAPVG